MSDPDLQRRWEAIHAEREAERLREWEAGRARYDEYRRRREGWLAAQGWRWVQDADNPDVERRMPPAPGRATGTLRELLMDAAALADAGMPQSLIVRPRRRR
jgi:hypothetical protein